MPLSFSFSPILLFKRLREGGSAATLNRLGTSQHVADLRLMFSATVSAVILACIVLLAVKFCSGDSLVSIAPFIGAAIALGSGIVGWAYQSGSARLGTVDLFACEIGTICRVCVITDLTNRYVGAFNADLRNDVKVPQREIDCIRRAFRHYDASENYTPVFDGYAADLRVLDVKVVTNVTAFYTYLKAMKDTLRNMTRITPPVGKGDAHDAWHEGLRNVIYMQFLTFESARKAIRDLIEFDPNQIENTINILINELTAYQFLMEQFNATNRNGPIEDFRHVRLHLRKDAYPAIVGRAYWRARDGDNYWSKRAATAEADVDSFSARTDQKHWSEAEKKTYRKAMSAIDRARQWRKAWETAHELVRRYRQAFPDKTEIERPADMPPPGSDDPDPR